MYLKFTVWGRVDFFPGGIVVRVAQSENISFGQTEGQTTLN